MSSGGAASAKANAMGAAISAGAKKLFTKENKEKASKALADSKAIAMKHHEELKAAGFYDKFGHFNQELVKPMTEYGGDVELDEGAFSVVSIGTKGRPMILDIDNLPARTKRGGAFRKVPEGPAPKATRGWPLEALSGVIEHLGLELDAPAGAAAALSRRCAAEQKLLLLPTSVFEVVRMIPPLTVSEEECDDALARLGAALAS